MPHLIFQQIDFIRSKASIQTARNIVWQKIANQEYILTGYIARVKRMDRHGTKYAALRELQQKICYEKNICQTKETIRDLSLTEARAAHCYWDAVSIICSQNIDWKRTPQFPKDQLNEIMSIGYRLLCVRCEKILLEAGIYLEAGVIHGANSKKPMLYDFVEQFRQPFVDKVIIACFSRNSSGKINSQIYKKILGQMQELYSKRFFYKGRCERGERIFLLEAYELKTAIMENREYIPYRYPWGNSRGC